MDELVKGSQEQIRRNLLNSFGFIPQMNIQEEGTDESKLQKGVLSYQITSSPSFVISKSGKLIKEKLQSIKELANQKLLECQSKYQNLRSQISEEPLQETNDYDTIMNLRIQPIPKTYTWEQINPSSGDKDISYSSENYSIEPAMPLKKASVIGVADLMRQYNNEVYSYSSYKKDLAMINIMLENFQDNKNYDLSVEQATIFGF